MIFSIAYMENIFFFFIDAIIVNFNHYLFIHLLITFIFYNFNKK